MGVAYTGGAALVYGGCRSRTRRMRHRHTGGAGLGGDEVGVGVAVDAAVAEGGYTRGRRSTEAGGDEDAEAAGVHGSVNGGADFRTRQERGEEALDDGLHLRASDTCGGGDGGRSAFGGAPADQRLPHGEIVLQHGQIRLVTGLDSP